MALYAIRPLDDRTGFTGNSKHSNFKRQGSGDQWWRREPVPFSQTRTLLERELNMLGAENVILEVDVLPSMIRLDGELYANARPASPAVRLHFDSKHGHLTYATDTFTTWQDNVRAIALALEALRKVDRFGVGQGGDQYRGYLALEAGTGATALGAEPAMTQTDAREILSIAAGTGHTLSRLDGPDKVKSIYRSARANAHPDRHDGDRAGWDLVERAASVLGLS